MRCSKAQEGLCRYAAGECSSRERAEIAGHLAICPGCAARLSDLQELNGLLDLWQQEPAPEDLLEQVMQQAGKPPAPVQQQRRGQPGPIFNCPAVLLRHLAMAAALALALAWCGGPWLSGSQALAVSDADKLVSGYTTASDNFLQGAVGRLETLLNKLNLEEWMRK